MIKKCKIMIVCLALATFAANAQESFLSLDDLKKPLGDWFEAGDVKLLEENEKLLDPIDGKGVFVNGKTGKTSHFITTDRHGDVTLRLEFMVAKESNSGVYLQGRYEVQILDSWGREEIGSGDCGGIYQRWDKKREGNKGYDGIPPKVNACKPPGEWQTLFVQFQAPRFNARGKKKKNAIFKKVVLNGVIIHKNVEATGPTRSSLDNLEEPTGPLMLQGDHGPVAYRRIQLKSVKPLIYRIR